MLLEWVNPLYLDISYQEQIQNEFEDNSEIQLKDFIKVAALPSSSLPVSRYSSRFIVRLFPQEEKFREVSEALRQTGIQWMKRGPPNKRWVTSASSTVSHLADSHAKCCFRCYESASVDSLPECVSLCWELLRSEAFFLLLSNFTGLRLHYLCPADEEDEDRETKDDKEEGEVAGTSAESPSSSSSSKAGADNGGKSM